MNYTDTVNLYLAYVSNSEINIYFNNQINISNVNRTIFSNSKFNLNNPSSPISLFHGFYYNIYNNDSDLLDESELVTEYESLRNYIIEKINSYQLNSSYCNGSFGENNNVYKDNSNFKSLSYLGLQFQILNFNRTTILKKDNFSILVSPIVLNNTLFDPYAMVFSKECNPFIISYAISIVRTGSLTIPDEINKILALKTIRSYFFFLSLLVFAIMVYFIVCEIYVKFLIVPIKHIKLKLDKLIKGRNENEEVENKIQGNNSISRNTETKKLEEMVNNLQKIISMKNAQGKPDFKEKSKIYKKFLEDNGNKDEKENKKQCFLIIAYSFYKDNDFVRSEKFLKKLISLTEAEEDEILSKNESFEQKLISYQPPNDNLAYFNDFTPNEFQDPELIKYAKLKILNQKIFYFYGYLKYSEYKKLQKERKWDETNGLILAKKMLQKSLKINQSMHRNQIKCIFIQILLSKCSYLTEEYTEASNYLRDALIEFTEINKHFFEKKIHEKIDPRVMFIINGIIMEQVLYNIGKICISVGKKKLAAIVFNRILDITYFRTQKIQKKSLEKLYKILFDESENRELKNRIGEDKLKTIEYKLSKRMLKKMINRFNGETKSLLMMISKNLLNRLNSKTDLKDVIIKGIEISMNIDDKIKVVLFDDKVEILFNSNTVASNLAEMKKNENFWDFKIQSNQAEDTFKTQFHNLIKNLVLEMKAEDGPMDKYIFLFVSDQDFKFNDKSEAKEIRDLLRNEYITLYVFVFNEFEKPEREEKVSSFVGDLVEGYLVLVKNFKIIEESFQNLTPFIKNNKKSNDNSDGTDSSFAHNILDSNFENHLNIK